jgi:methylisocitrate lyase
MAATRLGRPHRALTQTEVLDTARLVCAATPCPVIVDIDTGWGGPLNVQRSVTELLRLGAAGCFLEDQEWPKRCGHMEGKRVVPLEEYLPKLHTALQLRAGTTFHITARTDARAVVGLDEAIRRARTA